MFGVLKYASGVQQLVEFTPISATDPGFGVGAPPVDPDWGMGTHPHPGHGLPGYGHPDQGLPWAPGRPGNALPIAPVRPSQPIVLPPNVWPPSVPSIPGHPDNSLPPEAGHKPIEIPPDPNLGIEHPIVIPPLPVGVALLISLPNAQPKADAPPNTKPAILVQSGQKPVLVYVSAAPTAAPK